MTTRFDKFLTSIHDLPRRETCAEAAALACKYVVRFLTPQRITNARGIGGISHSH